MTFTTAVLDPPWQERGGGKIKRGADRHYALAKTADLPWIIRGSGLWEPDPTGASVWLWATVNHLPDAMWLLNQLRAEYVTNATWVKISSAPNKALAKAMAGVVPLDFLMTAALAIGLGQRFRCAHEHLLYARIGSVPVPEPKRRLPSVFFAPSKRHSKKPQEAFRLIETHDAHLRGGKVEFFARSPRPGWQVWGAEVPNAE